MIANLFAKLLSGLSSKNATQGSSAARHCSAGHVLDPTWGGQCPYCDAAKRVHEKSPPVFAMQATAAPSASDRRTRVGEPAAARDRLTKIDSGDASSAGQQGVDTRRIMGVLITYTWQPGGEMFALREGKNRIGAGRTSDETRRPCEIQITTDPAMSGEHALILCRHGMYEMVDLNSSNGTFVNDAMVSTRPVPLESGATIKTGDTVFQFFKFQRDSGAPVE